MQKHVAKAKPAAKPAGKAAKPTPHAHDLRSTLAWLKSEGDLGEDVALLLRFIEASERGVIK